MKNALHLIIYILIYASFLLLPACNVHEWPDAPERVTFHLRLSYETEMTEWSHLYDGSVVTEVGRGETYDNRRESGEMRYIVRAYPVSEKQRAAQEYAEEFVFTKDIAAGYDHSVDLELPAGNYNLMVWSDLTQVGGDLPFHDAGSFAEVRLQGEHRGNNDYRDAFRGTGSVELVADIVERRPDTLDIAMQRPLAKFEFITNDVLEFIDKEATRIATKAEENEVASAGNSQTKTVDLDDYKVVFYYVGFMPDAFSIYTDKPVDSATGVLFESSLKKLTEEEATMGFDYVFVNGKESAVTVQVGIYDKEETQLSLTEPIEVPLTRSHHTLLTGMFLMSEASGGVSINPEFEGDHNLIFP